MDTTKKKFYLVAIDPPGTPKRKWGCKYCAQQDTLPKLMSKPCRDKNATHNNPY